MAEIQSPGAFILRNVDGLMIAGNRHVTSGTEAAGWRRWVWTKSIADAEKWGTRQAAESFADRWLPGAWSAQALLPAETPRPAVG